MTSRTERFERKAKSTSDSKQKGGEDEKEILRFSPEEEAALLKESNGLKDQANAAFAAALYPEATSTYNQALESCPKYLHFERAVLKSNIAACHLKTSEWKDAVIAASDSLDLLDKAEGKQPKNTADGESEDGDGADDRPQEEEEEADEEIISPGAARAEDTSAAAATKREADIARIRTKALMRRGKARMEIASWSSLQGAEEDYKALSTMPDLSPADKKVVQRALALLPARVKVAQEKEMGEMMGKLKELGNGILKPFGLSTDNFQMVKDEKTGGYSMNFNQGGKS